MSYNVGIGTSNPTAKLHVLGDCRIEGNFTVNGTQSIINVGITNSEQLNITNDGTGPALTINQKGAQPIADFQDDGVSSFYIADGGNVGIGITNPSNKLDVNGSVRLSGATIINGILTINNNISGTGNAIFNTLNISNTSILNGAVTINNTLFVANTLTVGSLNITSGSSLSGATVINNTLNVTGNATLSSLSVSTGATISGPTTLNNSLTITGNITIQNSIFIANGNVGIGITTPVFNLHVAGTSTTGIGLAVQNNCNTSYSILRLYNDNSNGVIFMNGSTRTSDGGINALMLRNDSGGDIRLQHNLNFNGSSLVGTTFKGNGFVGIGTTNPDVNLHLVSNNANDMRCQSNSLINYENSQITSIQTSSNTQSYSLIRSAKNSASGYQDWYWQLDSTGNYQLVQAGVNGTYNYTSRLYVASNGRIGMGIASPAYPLHVSGSVNSGTTSAYAGYGGLYAWQNMTSSWDVGIYSVNSILTSQAFVSLSDQRMKENIQDIDDSNALDKLRLIKPKTYQYIDKVNKGNSSVYGFIAQDVKDVLPYATSTIVESIPSIMTMATVLAINNNDITLQINKNHNLLANNKVKIIYENGKNKINDVTQIVNNNTFIITDNDNKLSINDEVFVYGKQVDDFMTIDKNAIFTVGIGAIQQLDNIIQTQQNSIVNLENTISSQQSQINNIMSILQSKGLTN